MGRGRALRTRKISFLPWFFQKYLRSSAFISVLLSKCQVARILSLINNDAVVGGRTTLKRGHSFSPPISANLRQSLGAFEAYLRRLAWIRGWFWAATFNCGDTWLELLLRHPCGWNSGRVVLCFVAHSPLTFYHPFHIPEYRVSNIERRISNIHIEYYFSFGRA